MLWIQTKAIGSWTQGCHLAILKYGSPWKLHSYGCMGFMALTTTVVCAPGLGIHYCQCQCVMSVSYSPLLDLNAEESRVPKHVKPPLCGVASRNPSALSWDRTSAVTWKFGRMLAIKTAQCLFWVQIVICLNKSCQFFLNDWGVWRAGLILRLHKTNKSPVTWRKYFLSQSHFGNCRSYAS